MSSVPDQSVTEPFAHAVVYIVDDNKELCSVMQRHFEKAGLRCRVCHDADEFLITYDPAQPGCLILDIRMPGMDGLDLQEKLRKAGDSMPVLVLTGHADVKNVLRAWTNEAFQFLQKPVSNHALLEHVMEALEKDRRSREEQGEVADYGSRISRLTKRETEVMDLVVSGRPNKVVGVELGLSQKTVEVHRSNVMKKMRARSFAELVQMVMVARGGEGPALRPGQRE